MSRNDLLEQFDRFQRHEALPAGQHLRLQHISHASRLTPADPLSGLTIKPAGRDSRHPRVFQTRPHSCNQQQQDDSACAAAQP
jgi:hypothetical protein